jgi:hypothetical protein
MTKEEQKPGVVLTSKDVFIIIILMLFAIYVVASLCLVETIRTKEKIEMLEQRITNVSNAILQNMVLLDEDLLQIVEELNELKRSIGD